MRTLWITSAHFIVEVSHVVHLTPYKIREHPGTLKARCQPQWSFLVAQVLIWNMLVLGRGQDHHSVAGTHVKLLES